MDQVDVSRVMAEIRMRASAELRARAFDRGNTPEFSDAELFDIVEQILRSAVDESDRKVLLLRLAEEGGSALGLDAVRPDVEERRKRTHAALKRVRSLVDVDLLLSDRAWR